MSNNAEKSSSFFYGWIISIVSGIGIAFSVSIFIPGTIGILMGNLIKEFGWTPTQIIWGPSWATLSTICVAPFLGGIVDKLGAKKVIAVSFIIEALIIMSFRYINGNIYLFWARYAAFAILATGTTAVPFMKIISCWFDKSRGFALGIALACYGMGGVMWSKVTPVLFETFGWRESFTYIGLFILVIILPILLVFIRDTPESKGLKCYGSTDDASAAAIVIKPEVASMTLGEAAGGLQFWKIAFGFFFIAAAIQSINMLIVPMLTSRGISVQTAATVQAWLWATTIVGRLSTGWLMDKIFAPRVAIMFLVPAIIGMYLLGSGAIGALAILAAMLVGLANGSEASVIPYITGRYYGLKNFTKIYGTFFSCFCIGATVGPLVTTKIVAAAGGSYQATSWTHPATLVLAGLILFTFMRFPKPEKPA